MDQSEHRWKAYVSMYDLGTGRHLVFDSIYSSSCLRRVQPEPDTWQYYEHSGWWTKDNQACVPLRCQWLYCEWHLK